MADEIKLKAPTVEQQVVVNINGEEKLRSFADTLDKISNNKNLQKYWKTQQELINATANAYGNFQKKASKDNATELIKVTNALKAMSGTDLSNILPDFDKISKAMAEAQKVVGNIDSAFSVKGFKEAFDSFETLKAYSEDIEKIFSHFGVSSDVGELQNNVRALEGEVEKLTRRLANAKNANEELRNEFNNFKSGSGFADKLDELDNLKSEMSYIREEAEETFRQFLKLNNVSEDGYDRDGFYDDNRFREYFQNIQSGYMSASDAIRQFKTEYSYLLEESFKTNNDTFGLEQLQAFSNKLDSIFRQVEETSTKINDIISNGVITKSVENLSIDSSLSDSQRSLFGNLLQDEESLKSITALFQKLIEESSKTSKVDLFNDEQLQQVLSIFDKMEGHLSSLRSIISDVGDGEEFSPLLKMINNVQSSISELATSVKGIGLNMSIDVGSDGEMEAKVQSKIANALQAYQRLFDHIKMSSAGGQIITDKFFDFDINQYDTMMGKLQGYKKFIDNMRKEAKAQFNGQDVLYQDTEKSFWTQASSAAGQVTKVFNEMKAASGTNPLADMFGKTDLSEVISQLGLIVAKLGEISTTASEFKNVFANGFNVSASVEEIEKLTSRVKEFEDELSKVQVSSTTPVETNISSGNEVVEAQNKIQEELEETQQKAKETAESIISVYRGLKSSTDEMFDSKNQSAWFSDNVESARSFGRYTDENLYKANIRLDNPMVIDAMGANHDNILYAETVEELEKAIKLQDELNKKREEFNSKYGKYLETQDMSYLDDTSAYLKASDELDALEERLQQYKKTTEELQLIAKNNGHDGLIIKNVMDNFLDGSSDLGTSYAVFNKECILSTELLKRQEVQALATTQAEEKLADAQKKESSTPPIKDTFQGDVKASAESSTPAVKEEAKAMEQVAENAEKASKGKDNFAKVNKKVKESADSSSKAVSEEASEFNKIIGKLDGYNTKLANFTVKPADGNRYPIYQKNIDDLTEKINKLQVLSEKDINLINTNDVEDAKALQKQIDELIFKMSKMSASEKGFDPLGADKALEKINSELKKNSAMSKEAKRQIQGFYDEIRSGNPSKPIKDLLDDMYKLIQAERLAGREGKSFMDIFKEKVVYGAAANMAGMIGIYDIINVGREGITVIRELDTALTEMRKVSDETVSSLEKFQDVSFDLADDVGTTAKQIQNSTADYMRLGEALDEASESARVANILLNVSEFDNIDDATSSLVSMGQAYKDLEKIEIVDKLNEVGNNYAISTDELAVAMQKSAATLSLMGNSIDETASMITTANSVLQDADTVSAGLRTISLRIVGTEQAEEQLEAMNEEIDAFVTQTNAKKQQIIKDYTAVASNNYKGFDILDENGNYKSTYDILLGISKIYKEIQEEDKKLGTNRAVALVEELAGKNRSNVASAILSDPTQLEAVKKSSEEAFGSAQEELDKFLESIDGKHLPYYIEIYN